MTISFAEAAVVPSEDQHTGQIQQLHVRLEAYEVSRVDMLDRKEVIHLVFDPGKRADAYGDLGVIGYRGADLTIPIRSVLGPLRIVGLSPAITTTRR